jgi:hypothetical protein
MKLGLGRKHRPRALFFRVLKSRALAEPRHRE